MNSCKVEDREGMVLYNMCKRFIEQADKLRENGGLSDSEYESLVKVKRQYIQENKHFEG